MNSSLSSGAIFGGFVLWSFLIFMGFFFLYFELYLLSILFFFLCIAFTIWSIYDIKQSQKPSKISYEERTKSDQYLEKREVQEFIHDLHNKKHKNIRKIAKKTEKRFNIKLSYNKGRVAGDLIESVADKISIILGFKNYRDYWNKYGYKREYPYIRKKPISENAEKYFELSKIKKIARNYFDAGNSSEALKWYKKELKLLLELGFDNDSVTLEVKDRVELLKDSVKNQI